MPFLPVGRLMRFLWILCDVTSDCGVVVRIVVILLGYHDAQSRWGQPVESTLADRQTLGICEIGRVPGTVGGLQLAHGVGFDLLDSLASDRKDLSHLR